MPKVKGPLFSLKAQGQFGKALIFKRNGIVVNYFKPRNPNSAAQQAQREAFRSLYVAGLTQEQADLLYAVILHNHDDLYSPLGHDHDDLYSALGHTHLITQVFGSHALGQTVAAGVTSYLSIFAAGFLSALAANPISANGTIKNLRLRTGGTQPSSGSLQVTINIGGTATALTLTVPANDSTYSYSNLSNEVSYTAGGLIRIDVKNNASVASAPVGMVAFDFVRSQ